MQPLEPYGKKLIGDSPMINFTKIYGAPARAL